MVSENNENDRERGYGEGGVSAVDHISAGYSISLLDAVERISELKSKLSYFTNLSDDRFFYMDDLRAQRDDARRQLDAVKPALEYAQRMVEWTGRN